MHFGGPFIRVSLHYLVPLLLEEGARVKISCAQAMWRVAVLILGLVPILVRVLSVNLVKSSESDVSEMQANQIKILQLASDDS